VIFVHQHFGIGEATGALCGHEDRGSESELGSMSGEAKLGHGSATLVGLLCGPVVGNLRRAS
jgi:hypothetical protein